VKRSPDIIQAFIKVAKKYDNARLEMIGSGPTLEYCRDLAISGGINDKVNFRGSLLNVPKVLCFTDVFIIPSEIESFGLAALEAMSCKIPVIASTAGGLPEVVEDKKAGLLVKPGDVQSLAESMMLLIEDETLRKQLGETASKIAKDKFHPDTIVPQYEALYKEIVGEK
jgi:glycosyltransferase involved in cell wall biosynthesis